MEVLYTELSSLSAVQIFFNITEIELFNKTIILIENILFKINIEIQALENNLIGMSSTTSLGHSSSTTGFASSSTASSSFTRTTELYSTTNGYSFTSFQNSDFSGSSWFTPMYSYSSSYSVSSSSPQQTRKGHYLNI